MDKKVLNAFQILELEANASIDEIKKAYKHKARCYHPDLFYDAKDKKEAEIEFKKIKEAYDYLIANQIQYEWEQQETNEEFCDFFNRNNFFDETEDDFYYEQEYKTNKFETLQKKAINVIEQEIKNRNIHQLKVFELIKQNKIILTWLPGEISSDVLYDFLVKENLYRRYIKNSDLYKGYLKNEKFYHHLDSYATLTINPDKYQKKKFEKRFYYHVQSICEYCNGCGCEYCSYHGICWKEHNINIKVPIINQSKLYEIKNGGNQTPLMNGKLILKVKLNRNLKEPFNLDFKKSNYETMVPLLDAFDYIKQLFNKIWNWIINHKHLSFLYLLIIILIIIIICMGILL